MTQNSFSIYSKLMFVIVFITVTITKVYSESKTIFRIQDETQLLHLPPLSDEYFKDTTLTIDELRNISQKRPVNIEAVVQLCYMLKKNGEHQDAVNVIISAVNDNPTDPMLLNMAGAVLLHSGKYDELMDICRKAVAFNPKLADAYNLLGVTSMDRGYTGTAIYHFEKALSLKKKKFNLVNFNLANAYRANGDYDKAIELYRKASKKFLADKNFVYTKNFRFRLPNENWIYNNVGLTMTMAGQYEDALKEFRKALDGTSKGAARVMNGMACTFYEMGERDSCISYLQKAQNTNPRYSPSFKNLGNVYYEMGNYQKALENFEKALCIDPSDQWLIYKMGCSYKNLKEYDKGIEFFTRSLDINPSDGESMYEMALCYYRLSNTDKSQEYFKKAFKYGVENARGWIRN